MTHPAAIAHKLDEMTEITYPGFVGSLLKPGQAILDSLTPAKCHIMHMLIGVVGEAKELHDNENYSNLLEELGDVEFYLTGLEFHNELIGKISKGDMILDCHIPYHSTVAGYTADILNYAHRALELGVKKYVLYNKNVGGHAVEEELRAIHRLLAGLYKHQGITRAQVLELNKAKLDKRYVAGYSDKAAQERADKVGTCEDEGCPHYGTDHSHPNE